MKKVLVKLTKDEIQVIADSLGVNNESYVFTECNVDGAELETRLWNIVRELNKEEQKQNER